MEVGLRRRKRLSRIKNRLTHVSLMALYRQEAETHVTTDTSPVGIGAVLEQKREDGQYGPLHYASRKLSAVESRYSQVEREALAVKGAARKFTFNRV